MIRVTAAAMIIAMFLVLAALTRRPRIAFLWTLELTGVIVIASFVKQSYEGMALTVGDLYFFLLNPVQNFAVFWNYPRIGLAFLGVVAVSVGLPLVGRRFEQPMFALSTSPAGFVWRALIVLGAVVVGAGSTLFEEVELRRPVSSAGYVRMSALQPHGIYEHLNVFFEHRGKGTTLPPFRAQNRFKPGTPAPFADGQNKQRPDILMVFEESVFDPTMLKTCRFPECDLPMFHPLAFAADVQEGPLLTHTSGGGSWLTEFSFLSGLDWRLFGRGGAMAPISLAPRLRTALPRRLRELGYRTVAVYASDEFFLGAKGAYSHYGFDEFHGARELKLSRDWAETRDHEMFEKALAIVKQSEDPRPLFLFVFTTRTHGPYNAFEFEVPEKYRTVASEINPVFADYLSRLTDSSKDFVDLAKLWLDSPRPRVIGWFGDHQPKVNVLRSLEDVNGYRYPEVTLDQLKYVTRYQLSSNSPPYRPRRPLQTLDIAYLGDEILEFAGLPLDDAAIAGLSVAEECKGRFLDCPNRDLIADYVSYRVHELKTLK